MESILTSIKILLGIGEEYEHFDQPIIMHINSVFGDLMQLGIGPPEGFRIEDETAVWTDFMSDMSKVESVKSYMYLRVKLLFDSQTLPSSVIESYNRQIEKAEWRLNAAVETEF
jgi:hypothetical protein